MKSKFLVGLLTATMVIGCMTGCGSSTESSTAKTSTVAEKDTTATTAVEAGNESTSMEAAADATSAESTGSNSVETKPYKLAVGLPDSGATMFSLMSNNIKTFVNATGGEVVFQGGVGASADATIQFVEDQIAAGANGIIISPPSDSVIPTVDSLCSDAGVYWGITFRTVKDDAVKELLNSSKYYIGNCSEDEYSAGYKVMSNLHDKGVTKVAIISQAKGNTTTDLREAGANKACQDFGMEIVAEARSLTQASDATSAAESFLTAYSDLDAIFVVGTTGTGMHEAIAKAIEDAGRQNDVKLATIDFPDSMVSLFESGDLVTCAGLASWGYDPFMITVTLANQCMGCPISNTPVSYSCNMFDINDLDTAKAWVSRFGNDQTLYYDKDTMVKTYCKANNSGLTADSMQKAITDFTENSLSK